MKVYLTAIVQSKDGRSERLKPILQNMVQHSRKEEACLQYDLFQSTEDENSFVFNEIWASQSGLDWHNEQPYIIDFVKSSEELLADIQILKTVKIS
ncbi:putative quinol monooxygenase [Pedobacter aquatilis]|uniref:putative quinol monooxygenase n=1 Tax=Pedobacter aquatilis TaxID=351343 RepID=UPI002930B69A|nr:putative quinol monooxygenase [Pedobacter aquatilis]